MTPTQIIFVALTIGGTLLVLLPDKTKSLLQWSPAVFWPLFGAIAIGLSDTLSKGSIDATSASTFIFALAFMQVPVALVFLAMEKQSLSKIAAVTQKWHLYWPTLLGAFINIAATIFYWLAFEKTLASIASPITATYPVLLVVLAMLLLKEHPTRRVIAGVLLSVIGVAGLGYFQ